MADAILSFAVESIGKLLIEEANFLQGVSEQVRQLHEDLKQMEWFLKYADTKQSVRERVQPWVAEFKAIAYEANDLVEDYAFRVSSQDSTSFLERYARIFSECYTHHNLGLEIQSLKNRISNLTHRFAEYGITTIMEQQASSSTQQNLRRTYSFEADEDFIGLEIDVEILVKCLLDEGQFGSQKVISIYGMGGLGKTTLARRVYHNPRLRKYFSGFAWICVSQQWQPRDLLQEMLVKLIPDSEQRTPTMNCTEQELGAKLRQVLQQRRCLVVLDDIWSMEAWDSIKHAFPMTEEGSKIFLTTRKRDVALHIDPDGYHHEPPLLNEDESWELLRKKSLGNKRDEVTYVEDYHKLEKLGRAMVKYCGGLRFAVVVLGGILKTRKSLSEWMVVHENVKSYLEKGESIGQGEGELSNILAFSYYDLPYQLKPCFLYLGKFKEDSAIDAETLYELWLAEGMVLTNDRVGQESMMDVVERYLEELAKRCMVQVEIHEVQPAITKFKSCRVHDLMRDVCLLKAKEENLYKVIEIDQNAVVKLAQSQPAIEGHYRFILRLHGVESLYPNVYIPLHKEQTKHLRSFLCEPMNGDNKNKFPGRRIMSQVNNLKMLRILAVENSNMASQSFYSRSLMQFIGNLIHLRCLSLRACTDLTLPSSLGNLKYLETLDLSDSVCSTIPNVLSKLGRLRHLYLPYCHSDRKLQLDGLGMSLEILGSFHNRFCLPRDLSKLTNLRALKAIVHENLEDLEQFINHISNLSHLRVSSLTITVHDFGINSNRQEGVALLEQVLFSKNIHEIEIWGTLCKQLPVFQPSHLVPPPCLTKLELHGSGIEEDPMRTLEKLPNLQTLGLHEASFEGKEMICHAMGFPRLKVLELNSLRNLEKWKVDKGAMPKLSSLQIRRCEKLEMIPDGLKSMTTLRELKLLTMPGEFINRVEVVNGERGPDYDKISHVPSVEIC